ncbi:MAG: membrane protein insertase YidC [Polyangiaceae bacterium]
MERTSLVRWLLIGVAVFLFVQFGLPTITGANKKSEFQPWGSIIDSVDPTGATGAERAPMEVCDIEGVRFKAQLTTRGGSLAHFWPTDEKYLDIDSHELVDLISTKDESRMPLRTDFRGVTVGSFDGEGKLVVQQEPSSTQVAYDDFDWKLEAQTGNACTFVYEDDEVRLQKTIRATERPFELALQVSVTNKSDQSQTHRLAVQQSAERTVEETKGSWGRQSPFLTKVEVYADDKVTRYLPSDFEPEDFEDEDFTSEKWRRPPEAAGWAAVSSSYFSQALFPLKAPTKPSGEMQIEEWWDHHKFAKKDKDPAFRHVYRARLNYGEVKLDPGATETYELLSYQGPKERQVLAAVGGGDLHATELLDLGVFNVIGKLLIQYLYVLYGLIGTWGVAICLMTITVKVVLFPLSIAQIKSSMAMRKLKPQMDEINEKYKDDATQRGVAMQELWRQNNVTNPMLGCLPVLLQMPVWFALYTALQTAVELYHTKFLWFTDLSSSDPYYVLPLLLGGSSFLQQQLMPMQGDAMQQKMMKFLMPAMFTAFMFFLPAGLGIYFLTNTWLGIVQQLAVERYYKSQEDSAPAEPKDEEEPEKSPKGDNKTKASRAKRAKARA